MKNKVNKKQSNIIKKIVCLLLAIVLIYYGGMKIWASTVDTTDITFSDSNLYSSLRTRLSKYIVDRDDTTKTLSIQTDGLSEITELDLSSCSISNLSGMEYFTSLVSLDVAKNSISDVSYLASLTNLETLNISNNSISDISSLSSLTSLTTLNASSNSISSISVVSNFTKLQTLDVSNNAISTASAVLNLGSLTSLNVSQNSALTNLSDVLVPSLTTLNISSTGITSLEDISTCRNLINLNVSNNNLSTLSPIFETEKVDSTTVLILDDIEVLNVGYTTRTGMTSFSSTIQKMTALRELYAQGNGITNLSGISRIDTLEYINFDDNNISNISYFVTTSGDDVYKLSATQISLANNSISDISVMASLDKIEYLDLSGNNIADISPIEGFSFEYGLDLRNQEISMSVYKKSNNQNHYIILYNIMQSVVNESSVAYCENATFTQVGVTLNNQPPYDEDPYNYDKNPYLNVIITPDKTSSDELSITVNGGVTDGSTITFNISSSSSAVETLMFVDYRTEKTG